MRDLFSDVVRPSVKIESRAWYTLPVSVAVHAAIAAVVVVIPLMAGDILQAPASLEAFVVAPAPPAPPPPPPAAAPSKTQQAPENREQTTVLTEPPSGIAAEPAAPAIPGVPGGVSEGMPTGVVGSTGPLAVLPTIPPPPSFTEPVRLVPGGRIKYPAKTKDVRPVYPAIALASRVEGRVIIEAIIGPDGRVKNAKVVKSVALLDRAALDAVREWQFTPTLLNGVPVPVIMTVTVDFTLQ